MNPLHAQAFDPFRSRRDGRILGPALAQEAPLTPNPDKWRPVVYRDLQIPGPLDAPFRFAGRSPGADPPSHRAPDRGGDRRGDRGVDHGGGRRVKSPRQPREHLLRSPRRRPGRRGCRVRVIWRLRRVGFPVVVLELARPLTVRRTVAFSSAVSDGRVVVNGIEGQLVGSPGEALATAGRGVVPVLVSGVVPAFPEPVSVLVHARLAKKALDTRIDQAPFVLGLGPGFVAGVDCHAVIETMRGHRLGSVIREDLPSPTRASRASSGVPRRSASFTRRSMDPSAGTSGSGRSSRRGSSWGRSTARRSRRRSAAPSGG